MTNEQLDKIAMDFDEAIESHDPSKIVNQIKSAKRNFAHAPAYPLHDCTTISQLHMRNWISVILQSELIRYRNNYATIVSLWMRYLLLKRKTNRMYTL